jgi:hypothetical protein
MTRAAKKRERQSQPQSRRREDLTQHIGLKYIKRHVGGGTAGWHVAFLPRHKIPTRFWADQKHGGRPRALEKAIAWRDAMIRKHGIPVTPRRLIVPWTRCSPTGIRGVYLNYYRWAYIAQIAEKPGKYPRAYFGFRTHGGQRQALIAAVRHRVKEEQRVYGTVVTPLPKWLAKEVGVTGARDGKRKVAAKTRR